MPADQVEQRRLARAIRTDDAAQLAHANRKAHISERVDAPEVTAEPLDAEHAGDLTATGAGSAWSFCQSGLCQLLLGPVGRNDLTALDDIHRDEVGGEARAGRGRVTEPPIPCHARHVPESVSALRY